VEIGRPSLSLVVKPSWTNELDLPVTWFVIVPPWSVHVFPIRVLYGIVISRVWVETVRPSSGPLAPVALRLSYRYCEYQECLPSLPHS
jgi:hypothetical protein